MKSKHLNYIKSTGFNVPKDYFNTFEDNILSKINAEENVLSSKSTGFKTPIGYFDALEDGILNTLSEEKEPKVIPLLSRKAIVYISSIAAAVLILFNLSIFDTNISFEDLEVATVETYILEDDISSYEIAALLTEEELSESYLIDHNLKDENIEEYLLNTADIEALLIE